MFLDKIINKLLILFLVYTFFILPTLKYFEYVHGGVRVNGALISFALGVLIAFLMFFTLKKINTLKQDISLYFLIALFIYITFYQLVLYFHVKNYSDQGNIIFLKTISNTIIKPLALFFIGVKLQNLYKTKIFNLSIKFSWFLSTFILSFYTITNPRGFYLFLDNAKIYLQIADAYAILAFMFLSLIKKENIRFIAFLFSSVMLFALLSRTSFYLFVFSYMCYMFLLRRKSFFLLVASLFFLTSLYIIKNDIDLEELKNNRMIGFIITGSDKSLSSRDEMLDNGMIALSENWFFGDFLGEVRDNYGNTGAYMHNMLSFWRQFGFIPFITLVVLLLKTLLKIYKESIKGPNQYLILLLTGFIFIFGEMISARGYTFTSYWLFISAILSYNKQKDISENEQ
ncbi:hypothetical protein KUL156_27080 [Alteromonas sp. KUL156]|nr:hypothetical protein KUL154_49640 [Alteromonas sp. KUL154]GFE00116.1 hypothetical protein KUL156_27080 [Alteromonas sp. KUL156]